MGSAAPNIGALLVQVSDLSTSSIGEMLQCLVDVKTFATKNTSLPFKLPSQTKNGGKIPRRCAHDKLLGRT
jgi:hypothetical protein